MPIICTFYDIAIAMFYRDHAPPHFHVFVGGVEAVVSIADGTITGAIPPAARRRVERWRMARVDALLANWDRARAGVALDAIAPLR
jgi:hypothetical protein